MWGGEGDASARPRCGRERKRARGRRGAIGSDDRYDRSIEERVQTAVDRGRDDLRGWAICGRGHEHPRVWDDS